MLKNKIVNVAISLCLIISIVFGISLIKTKRCPCKKKSVYLAMGDYLTSIDNSFASIYYENNDIEEFNKFLSRKSMTSSELLRLISIDASIVHNGYTKSISSVIEDSCLITISLGYNDIMNNVRYNSISNSYVYDEEVVDRLLASLQSNLFDIIEVVKSINDKADIKLLSTYYPYPMVDNSDEELFNKINNSIEEACLDGGAIYVDINGVSNVDYIISDGVFPNDEGMRYIATII